MVNRSAWAVYQGIARGMGIDLVYEINQFAVGSTMPDITILLDIDAETGIGRKKKQAELDRMESEKLEFHKKVVEGYRLLAERDKNRMVKIDGRNSIEEIHRQIKGAVNNTLLRDGRGCDEEF